MTELEFAYKFKIKCEYTDRKFRDAIELGVARTANTSMHMETTKLQTMKVEPMLGAYEDELDQLNFEYCDEDEVEMTENMDDLEEEHLIEDDIVYLEAENSPSAFVDEYDGMMKDDGDQEQMEKDVMESSLGLLEQDDLDLTFEPEEESALAVSSFKVEPLNEGSVIMEEKVTSTTPRMTIEISHEKNSSRRRSSNIFKCDTCAATFSKYIEFTQHNKTHGNKRYQCSTCQKWFSKRYHLKNHQKIHIGEKKYQCTQCENKYTNQGNLDRHIRVYHNKEKAHSCFECGKTFSQITILRQHMATHTEERNFPCDVCHRAFKTESYLSLHKKRHMPGAPKPKKSKTTKRNKPPAKPCVCMECGKKFNSTTLYLSHKRSVLEKSYIQSYQALVLLIFNNSSLFF